MCELHSACSGGDVQVVKYVLSQKAVDINSREWKMKKTPVMVAGEWGYKEVVELLAESGADLSLSDKGGDNILHLACDKGHVEVVEYVLSLDKVDINSRGRWKRTPLIIAGINGNKKVVELLMRNGANPSLRDGPGKNILHYICWGGDVEVLKYILSLNKMDIDSRGERERTPLITAGLKGHKDVVELLVENGADLSLTDKRGDNILHFACDKGHVKVVEYVLSLHKVDINSRGRWKKTPLLTAGHNGHREVVELLLRNGANLALRDASGDNILHYICWEGYVDFVKYVLSLHRVDINQKGWKERTPLLSAAFKGHKDVVELLVQNGADLSVKDYAGDNILHYISREGNVEIVKYVLSLDIVDINAVNDKGKSAAAIATSKGRREVVHFLVSHGANM
ncbi:ankyrin repeat domain-containing protein 50-like [Haliotis asinina]|uniref:ankyrin repeat domain-containing protein 50-like n=1 Tax=Haliotis asinina TaxID=109174 RepID=UPI00353183CE